MRKPASAIAAQVTSSGSKAGGPVKVRVVQAVGGVRAIPVGRRVVLGLAAH
jgi:hypothetical protein